MRIITYKSASAFLENAIITLNQHEVENNLIIGVCNNIIKNIDKVPKDAVFITIVEHNRIIASSIKTMHKAIIASLDNNPKAIQKLVAFYKENNINLKGVIGKLELTETFTRYYDRKVAAKRLQLIYALEAVKHISESEGHFEVALTQDINAVNLLINSFYDETKMVHNKNIDLLIRNKKIFIWKKDDIIVSIAAIVRETTQVGIIGLVYTPISFRNKGYARSCVKKLSENMLQNGYTSCALFTDANNPTSNKIYQEIGYQLISTFQDIAFE